MNYKKIQTIVKHQFEWEKSFFFLVVGSTLVMKIFFMIFNPHPLLQILGIVLTTVPTFIFIKPEFIGKEPGFSGKYLLSFPLTRKELFLIQVISSLFSFLPLLIWLVAFYSYIFGDNDFFSSPTHAAFTLFVFAIFIGSFFPNQLYSYARGSQTKLGFREHGFMFFYMYSVLILLAIAGVSLSYFLQQQFGLNISSFVTIIIENFSTTLQKWLGVTVLTLAFCNYQNSKQLSHNDKSSFKKPLNYKRDLKQLGTLATFATLSLCLAWNVIPQLYQGELQVAVYNQDYKEIQKLLGSGVDINRPNDFGMTPMMVALKSGDLKLVEFLETKGANYDGEINKVDDKTNGFDARLFAVYSGNIKLLEHIKDKVPSFDNSNALKTIYPIHVAAKYCKSRVVDYLISNGVDIEARNDKGNTPVVVAARNNCFESVVSLKEAGARFDVLDTKGKVALNDLGKKASPELKMFVEKNMRTPASK